MADFASLARNLLTLEINTVEKDGMSGQKMPDGPNALVETATGYWEFLCRKAGDFGPHDQPLPLWLRMVSLSFDWGAEPFPAPHEEDPAATAMVARLRHGAAGAAARACREDFLRAAPESVTASVLDNLREVAFWVTEMHARIQSMADPRNDSFRTLREDVRAVLERDRQPDAIRNAARLLRAQERSILHRIRRNCDQFKVMFAAGRPAEITRQSPEDAITATDLVPLRKAWDIGTEIILLQTVIQIDGDVVSRFQTGLGGEERAQLQLLHANAVDISFKYWRWLIDAVGKVAGQAVSTLLRTP